MVRVLTRWSLLAASGTISTRASVERERAAFRYTYTRGFEEYVGRQSERACPKCGHRNVVDFGGPWLCWTCGAKSDPTPQEAAAKRRFPR